MLVDCKHNPTVKAGDVIYQYPHYGFENAADDTDVSGIRHMSVIKIFHRPGSVVHGTDGGHGARLLNPNRWLLAPKEVPSCGGTEQRTASLERSCATRCLKTGGIWSDKVSDNFRIINPTKYQILT
jgi:hypothetical protein